MYEVRMRWSEMGGALRRPWHAEARLRKENAAHSDTARDGSGVVGTPVDL
jgi:hypothetical protein